MKLDKSLHDLLNQQIKNEMDSSYTYLAMSAWFESQPYPGFSQWMYVQSLEETEHAMKFFRFLADRDAKISLLTLDAPKQEYKNPLEVFKSSLEQEQKVTKQIHDIYSLALEVKDHSTKNFLNWFLEEQIEEEKLVRDMIDRLELVKDHPVGLIQLDTEAAQRKSLTPEK